MSEVLEVGRNSDTGENEKKHSYLDFLRGIEPGELFFHDHNERSSMFSRWLAVTRKRVGMRLRHTNRDVRWVSLNPKELKQKVGYGILDDGRNSIFLHATRDQDQNVTLKVVSEDSIPKLPEGFYLLWVWDQKTAISK